MSADDTKSRILDTAECLFANNGYAATSLRNIIAEAEVNLAAIHYHYHSKEELLDAIVSRRADVVNQMRIDMLNHFREEAGGRPVELERIFEAFLAPPFEMVEKAGEGGLQFCRLMGRLYAEGEFTEGMMRAKFGPVIELFRAALQETLPDLPPQELWWRIQFFVGAMAHTLRWGQSDLIPGGRATSYDSRQTVNRLIAFLAAGFRVPANAFAGGDRP